jgi:hypothetical protein
MKRPEELNIHPPVHRYRLNLNFLTGGLEKAADRETENYDKTVFHEDQWIGQNGVAI